MRQLGNGLSDARRHEEALCVRVSQLTLLQRIDDAFDEVPWTWGGERAELQGDILVAWGNLARTYRALGRSEEALRVVRDAYFEHCRLLGEDDTESLVLAENYASSIGGQGHFDEAKALLRKTMPMARRAIGESHELTLKLRRNYALALYKGDGATLDDLSKAVTTLEETARIARRVFGGSHPVTKGIERELRDARAALRARETPPGTR